MELEKLEIKKKEEGRERKQLNQEKQNEAKN